VCVWGGGGGNTPFEPESSSEEEEEEGEATPLPPSLPHEIRPSFDDILNQQVRVTIGVHLSKWTRLTLVFPNSQGLSVVPTLMETKSHIFGIL
jgi:hypothetical protein